MPGGAKLPRALADHPSGRRIYASHMVGSTAESFYRSQASSRLLATAESETPYIERLVQFWSNHFTVSVQRRSVIPFAEAFEREAIRPHVLGIFTDMLLAATAHPAMQLYLDNQISNGPQSFAQGNLNENLAREILELHTLGIDGVYTLREIREFALMLTGWGIDEPDSKHGKALFLRAYCGGLWRARNTITVRDDRSASRVPIPHLPTFACRCPPSRRCSRD